jgi:hypothetical protein
MRADEQLEYFGQAVPEAQLRGMAAAIVTGIDDGRPAPTAGFVWYRPQGQERRAEEGLREAA